MDARDPIEPLPEADPPGSETATIEPRLNAGIQRRQAHQAVFDTMLQEVFLSQRVQLRDPIGRMSKETIVYGGLYEGMEVAVKLLTVACDDVRDVIGAYGAFKVECEKTMILSRRSSHIVQVLEYGDAELPQDMPDEMREFFPLGIIPFMITERAPYGSLDSVMRRYRRLPGFDRLGLLEALAKATDGLREAHEHHVAHRDIKPQNILVFAPDEAKIADFGIARWRSRIQREEAVMLTPRYCSPEQAFFALTGQHEGLVGVKGDVYSWAVMTYEVVTGRHPFAWVTASIRGHVDAQSALLKAVAANDRRGFQPTGDITFDGLMDRCTADYHHRIDDILVVNRVLRQLVSRLKLD
ncbi:MAG: protein kinase domain-containing protein [Planctomycetota bacterium]